MPNAQQRRTEEPQLWMQVSRQSFLSPMSCWSSWCLWRGRYFVQGHAALSLCPLTQMDKTASFLEKGSPFPFLTFL